MDNFLGAIDWISRLTTIAVVLAFAVGILQWFRGILPALWRLGEGLANRKIALFADGDDSVALKNLLVDSKLFNEKNIIQITKSEYKKAENFSVFLAHWKSIASDLDFILSIKKDSTALIIYSPQEEGPIGKDDIAKINRHRNAILVNFRGRLLNDIVSSLITTSYEK